MARTSKQGARSRASRKQRQSRSDRSEQGGGTGGMQSSDASERMRGRATATAKAVVIGIDQYGGPPNDLTCCAVDVDAISRVLEEPYGFDEIRALRDDEATVERVEEELQWLAEESRVGDRRVVYFSGHGSTQLRDGLMEECLVLSDGFFESERFAERVAEIPPGVLTVILDTSFTGGTEAYVGDPAGAAELELARVKTWVPVGEEETAETVTEGGEPRKVSGYRRFGCAPTTTRGTASPQAAPGTGTVTSWGSASSRLARPGEPEIHGLMLLASLESEPAVANTSKTDGLSAFTYALIQSIEQLGPAATASEVIAAAGHRLRMLGVRQTPRAIESSRTGDLRFRRLLSTQRATAAESLRFISEPRFWEGVLAAAASQSTTWAASRREGDVMTAAYQPMTGSQQQSPFGTTQQQFGASGLGTSPLGTSHLGTSHLGATQQLSPEELQRVVPALAPVLASIVPALVPPIVNAIVQQQRQQGGGSGTGAFGWDGGAQGGFGQQGGFGGLQQYLGAGAYGQSEEVQRMLPALAPVLANVIPAIVPQILQNVLMQQRQTQGWGTTPSSQTQGYGQQQSGYGVNPELWQIVSQSVNSALQRIGINQGQMGGRF